MNLRNNKHFSFNWITLFLLTISTISFGQQSVNINFSGHLYFGFDYQMCTPTETNASPVKDFPLTFIADSGDSIELVTNSVGVFTVNSTFNSNLFSLIPSPLLDANTLNGVTTFDAVIIQKHINGTEPINCPFSRIAADANRDGAITEEDADTIRQAVVNNNPFTIEESWRIAPRFLAPTSFNFQHITAFTDKFWRTESSSPFDATLMLLGETYDYLGDQPVQHNEKTWMNGIRNWSFFPDNPAKCDTFQYDFVLIKLGDVNNSATINNLNTNSIADFSAVTYDITALTAENLTDEMELVVKIKSTYPLEGYQLGLKIDPEIIQINNVHPIEKDFEQSLNDYNTKLEEIAAGHLRTAWIVNYEKHPNGIDISGFREIIRLDVTLLTDKLKNSDLPNIVSFDNELLPYEFISGLQLLEEKDIKVMIKIRPKK